MSDNNSALISVSDICNSWLLKKGKTETHSWWKVLPIACEAVQELTLTTIPMVHHAILKRDSSGVFFELPKGFTDWVSVAIRVGERWVPVNPSTKLMPFPNSCDNGGKFDSEFSDIFKTRGCWKSWLNRSCTSNNADFFDEDFFKDDYSDTDTESTQPDNINNDWYPYGNGLYNLFPYFGYTYNTNSQGEAIQGYFTNAHRPDEIQFNVAQKIIMCPQNFPSDDLYLVYVGIGSADSMTSIPIKAQAAIEAYIDWKYVQNQRGKIGEAKGWKMLYDEQHRLLRARFNELTTTSVRRVYDRGYMVGGYGWGGAGMTTPACSSSTINYYITPFLTLYVLSAGTFVQSPDLVGKTIGYVIINDVTKNSGYVLTGDTLNFTDGTYFSGGEKITIVYA